MCVGSPNESRLFDFISVIISAVFCDQLRYVGRPVSSVPATGVAQVHHRESQDIVDALFAKS